MKHISIPFIILLLFTNFSFSQNFDLGTWNVVNLKYNLDKKWSVFGETQLRSLKLYDDFHYYEYKGGVTLKSNKNIAFTLGAGSYQTYKEGGNFVVPKNNNEFRIWPQINLFQTIGEFKIEQRYRSELRFTTSGYRNRFRYRLGVSYPFGEQKNDYKPFQVGLSNELFFSNKEPYFERNRMQFVFNYKPSKSITYQLGYLHQFDYKINDETGRDFIQIGYFIELFSKPNRNKSKVLEVEIKDN